MPPPDRATVGAAAAALNLPISDAQCDRLLAYLALLQRWNAVYNLTAIRDPAAMWQQHVLDCMAAIPPVQRHLHAQALDARPRILDVGSGGGLPGLVWASLMPEIDITCVDTVGKKAAFMRQAAAGLGLANVQILHARVEALTDSQPFDLVTSRAFASLADFTRCTRHLLAPTGQWVAMKGRPPTDELEALGWPPALFHVEPVAVPGLQAQRCLVWLRPPPTIPVTHP